MPRFFRHNSPTYAIASVITLSSANRALILNTFVRKVKPIRKQVHSQHRFIASRRPPAFPAGIVRCNNRGSLVPWNQFIHGLQIHIPLRFPLPVGIFYVRQALLLVHHCHRFVVFSNTPALGFFLCIQSVVTQTDALHRATKKHV